MVPYDDVGLIAQRFDLPGRPLHRFRPGHRQFELAGMDMNRLFRPRRHFVDDPAHAGDEIGILLANEHDVVRIGGEQVPDDVQKLPGKVLVDK